MRDRARRRGVSHKLIHAKPQRRQESELVSSARSVIRIRIAPSARKLLEPLGVFATWREISFHRAAGELPSSETRAFARKQPTLFQTEPHDDMSSRRDLNPRPPAPDETDLFTTGGVMDSPRGDLRQDLGNSRDCTALSSVRCSTLSYAHMRAARTRTSRPTVEEVADLFTTRFRFEQRSNSLSATNNGEQSNTDEGPLPHPRRA